MTKLVSNGVSSDGDSHDRVQQHVPPDGGWGWAVVVASFFISLIVDGVSFSFGILYPEILSAFGESEGKTQIVKSVMFGSFCFLGPFTGVLIKRFGARRVTITGGLISSAGFFLSSFSPNVDVMILLYGCVGGIGFALVYLTSLVMVGLYFEKRRALATGIAVCGSGVGGFVFAQCFELSIQTFGWRWTLRIMSAVVLNSVVCGSLYRPIGEKETSKVKDIPHIKTVDGEDKSPSWMSSKCGNVSAVIMELFDLSLLKYPPFLLFASSSFLYILAYHIPLNFLPAQALSIQLSSLDGAYLVSIIGISNILVRVLVGYVSDKPWANPVFIYIAMSIIGGLVTIFVPYYTSFGVLAIYAALIGAVMATFFSLMTIILAKLMGIQKLTSSLGINMMFMGISSFIGAPIAGVLSDITGNYNFTFFFAGLVLVLAGLTSLPLSCISKRKQKRKCNIIGFTNASFTPEQTPNAVLVTFKQVSETQA